MPITDEQAHALRAFLAFDPEYEWLTRQLADGERLHGYGELVYAAFVKAVRRRFAPAWTSAEVVGFVASLRINLRKQDIDLEPSAAEILIRQALGHPVSSHADDDTHARVLLFALGQLISDEHLDDVQLDAFLAEARSMPDARLAHGVRGDSEPGKPLQALSGLGRPRVWPGDRHTADGGGASCSRTHPPRMDEAVRGHWPWR